ncbi:COQ9 family protein [Altererythrobacter sp. FM1]|uniref:COQ9 family protein n=1 Tax=Tsuneonella flava TaxID=2055955 RepID=A0ABX7KEU8_9SPHN|nr:COQ9 family protein [Tsuneonella flava]QSB45944.1 COQ9 family protein [Tsuneonella flava]ROT97451.1 COQ9 family protein [Altererythrobacter sp. FM1]
MTLDELALALAPAIADSAAFDGWSDASLVAAAEMAGADVDVARLAYPGGAMDMIAAWIGTVDLAMAEALPPGKLATMKIREKITALVLARLDAIAGREEALRRATAIMAMPQNVVRAGKLGWSSADKMWRMAGDTATDYNHYTKRAILSSIYAATLAVFANDETEEKAETRAFLDRRIDGVMRFEKAKAQLLKGDDQRFSISRFLGRLRYPAR